MKVIFKILFFVIAFFAASCNWFTMDKGSCFHISNHADFDIYTYAAYIAPDTLLPVSKPSIKLIKTKQSLMCAYTDIELKDLEFKKLKQGEYITVFFFSKDSVDSNSWEYIQENNCYQKRYNFTKDSPPQIFFP